MSDIIPVVQLDTRNVIVVQTHYQSAPFVPSLAPMHNWSDNPFALLAGVPVILESGPWLAVVLWLAAVGGCVGSFLNVVALRRPYGEDIVVQGSRCPLCRHPLRWWQNLPLVGWPLLGGRCYYCRGPIPIRYWLWEVAFALLFVGIGLATPWL